MNFLQKPKPKIKIVVLESDGKPHSYFAINERLTTGKILTAQGDNPGISEEKKVFAFDYKNYRNEKQYLYATEDYQPYLENGWKWYGKIAGNATAAQLIPGSTWSFGPVQWSKCPDQDMGNIIAHDMIARAGLTMKGKKDFPWVILIICVVVIIVAIFGYKIMTKNNGGKGGAPTIMTTGVPQ